MAKRVKRRQAKPRQRRRAQRSWESTWEYVRPMLVVSLLGLLGFSGWHGYQWLMRPTTLPIRQVKVVNQLRHVDSQLLAARLREDTRGGFFSLDLEKLSRELKAIPWIYDAAVRRIWPDRLEISIEEQQPIARWGDNLLLNRYGEVFDPGGAFKDLSLPKISGIHGRETDLILFFNQADRVLSPLGLRMVELREDARGDQRLILDNGIELALGRKNRIKRLKRFALAYRKTLQPFMNRIAVLDLRYANGFAVRWNRDEAGQYAKTGLNRI